MLAAPFLGFIGWTFYECPMFALKFWGFILLLLSWCAIGMFLITRP